MSKIEDLDGARARYEQRIRKLESFGHRGSTTDHERQAATYLSGELAALGLTAQIESFPDTAHSQADSYYPWLLRQQAQHSFGIFHSWPLH